MGHRPAWRAPVKKGYYPGVQSDDFKAKRAVVWWSIPKCKGHRRGDGQPCRMVACRGSDFCKWHGGLLKAAAAEAERLGKPVIILRRKWQSALGDLGATMAWPDGIPKRPDLLALGPRARGRLFEAWLNRELAPEVWKHELNRPRERRIRGDGPGQIPYKKRPPGV